MSQVLYEADNLSIKGHHYIAKTYSDLDTTSEWTDSDAIHLDFTLLINGKLKTFGWSFIIEKDDESSIKYSLAQYSDWNAIYLLFSNIGYKIWDSELAFWQSIISDWINTIMDSRKG